MVWWQEVIHVEGPSKPGPETFLTSPSFPFDTPCSPRFLLSQRTAKVQEAFKLGRIHVVNENWFNHSIALWRRQKERNFPVPLDDPQPSKPGGIATTSAARSNQVASKAKKKSTNTIPDTSDPSTSRATDKAEDTTAEVSEDTPSIPSEGAVLPTESTASSPSDALPSLNLELDADRTVNATSEATASTTAAGIAAMNGRTIDVDEEKTAARMTQAIGDDMLETINWASIDDEVDEVMGESDDEFDTKSQRSGIGSDDGWMSENR